MDAIGTQPAVLYGEVSLIQRYIYAESALIREVSLIQSVFYTYRGSTVELLALHMLAHAHLTAKESSVLRIRMETSLCVQLCPRLSVWLCCNILCIQTTVMLVVAKMTDDFVSMQLSCCCHGYGQHHLNCIGFKD